ncbi:unnamed protein product [Echinostoma caproni]|uniref:DUF4780 domain-containing protein n=1 Tax=Echinostoma caproni TaxID=27848 RepID=A0A183B3A3_9TREM|nr:unnamed protein product [Echinostoma caproni]
MQLSPLDSIHRRRSSRTVSLVSWEPSTVIAISPRPVVVANTYQLEPTPGREFKVGEAKAIVERILTERLGPNLREPVIGRTRRPDESFRCVFPKDDTPLVCWLANTVRECLVREISAVDLPKGGRHKLIVHVLHVDEPPTVPSAELIMSSCGLWNSDTDRWFAVHHQTAIGTIVVSVFACYHE